MSHPFFHANRYSRARAFRRLSARLTLAAYLSSLALAPFARAVETEGQTQSYQDANKALESSDKATEGSMIAWGLDAAVCGYGCLNYLFTLKKARLAVVQAAQNLNAQFALPDAAACTATSTYPAQMNVYNQKIIQLNGAAAPLDAAGAAGKQDGGKVIQQGAQQLDQWGHTPAENGQIERGIREGSSSPPGSSSLEPGILKPAGPPMAWLPFRLSLGFAAVFALWDQAEAEPVSGDVARGAADGEVSVSGPAVEPPPRGPWGNNNGANVVNDNGTPRYGPQSGGSASASPGTSGSPGAHPGGPGGQAGGAPKDGTRPAPADPARPNESIAQNAHLMAKEAQVGAMAAQVAGKTNYKDAAVCTRVANSVPSLAQTLDQAATQLDTVIAKVLSMGTTCSMTTIGAGVADAALSATLGHDIQQGIIGGVAGLVGGGGPLLLKMMQKGAPTEKTAGTLGIIQCVDTALSLGVVAMKYVQLNKNKQSEKENQQRIDDLNAGSQSSSLAPTRARWLTLLKRELQNPFVSCAMAAETPASFNACANVARTSPSILSCAAEADSLLRQKLLQTPGGLEGLVGRYEQTFGLGVSGLLALPTADARVETLLRQMTRDVPEATGAMAQIFEQAKQQAASAAGGALSLLPQAPGSTPPVGRGPRLFAPESLGFLSTGPSIAPAGGGDAPAAVPGAPSVARAPAAEPVTPEGIHAERSRNLFDIVGARYRQSLDVVEARPWSVPFNQYSSQQ